MISTQLIRRYPFFAGFKDNQLINLANVGDEKAVKANHIFFREGENLSHFYLVLDGRVAITIDVPDRSVIQPLSNQITGDLINTDITVSDVNGGNIFGWSAVIPPNISTANAKAATACRVVAFDFGALQPQIEKDCCFGYLLTLKIAQIIRERLRDKRIESLAEFA